MAKHAVWVYPMYKPSFFDLWEVVKQALTSCEYKPSFFDLRRMAKQALTSCEDIPCTNLLSLTFGRWRSKLWLRVSTSSLPSFYVPRDMARGHSTPEIWNTFSLQGSSKGSFPAHSSAYLLTSMLWQTPTCQVHPHLQRKHDMCHDNDTRPSQALIRTPNWQIYLHITLVEHWPFGICLKGDSWLVVNIRIPPVNSWQR